MDPECLMCLDWILASTEYNEFVCMMLEFKVQLIDKDFRNYKNGMKEKKKTRMIITMTKYNMKRMENTDRMHFLSSLTNQNYVINNMLK